MVKALTSDELEEQLKNLPHWEHRNDHLVTSFHFSDFLEGIDFVGALAELAEQRQHHPSIIIEHDVVTLELKSVDVDAITQKDIDMAHAIEQLQLDYNLAPDDTGFY